MSFFGEDTSSDDDDGVVRFDHHYVSSYTIRRGSRMYDLADAIRLFAVAPPRPSPQEFLRQHFASLCNGSATCLELRDRDVQHIIDMRHDATTGAEHAAVSAQREAVTHLHSAVLRTLQNTTSANIQGVSLEGKVLQLWTPAQQIAIYQALAARYSSTMTDLHLGIELDGAYGTYRANGLYGIPTEPFLSTLVSTTWPRLTSFEVGGIEISCTESLEHMVQFVQSISPALKTFYLLGIVVSPNMVTAYGYDNGTPGEALLDPLLKAFGSCRQLSDLQLHRMVLDNETEKMTRTPLFSSQALLHLIQAKQAWWRLTLDGMGLQDSHLEVLGSQLLSSKDYRVNIAFFVSVRNNPRLSSTALASLYHICMNKREMCMVLSDDDNLNALMILVDPLNNFHKRLDYKDEDGNFPSVDQWFAWLQVLSNLRREDDAFKLNSIWVTLLEEPTMIALAIDACSRSTKRIRRE